MRQIGMMASPDSTTNTSSDVTGSVFSAKYLQGIRDVVRSNTRDLHLCFGVLGSGLCRSPCKWHVCTQGTAMAYARCMHYES